MGMYEMRGEWDIGGVIVHEGRYRRDQHSLIWKASVRVLSYEKLSARLEAAGAWRIEVH